MKKIYLIRSNKNPYGGAEKYLLRLSRKLTLRNIDYQVINSKFPEFLPSWLRVFLFNLQLRILKNGKFYFSLERITSADIYRAGDGVHRAFLEIEKKSKLNPLHPLYLYLEKKSFINSKKIIVNSEMVKREIITYYNVSENKIKVIYNGYDPEKTDYSKSFKKISKEFKINRTNSILLFVGSGFQRKGVANFLKIVSLVNSKNVTAIVVGKETNMNVYKNLAQSLSIKDKVIFTGPRKDVHDFYNVADFFIFPAHYEPFGNVVLEAMGHSNVIFVSQQTGASEIIRPEFVMSTPEDYSVVNKINSLLNNKSLLTKLKKENFELSKKYSVDINVNETLKIINEINH